MEYKWKAKEVKGKKEGWGRGGGGKKDDDIWEMETTGGGQIGLILPLWQILSKIVDVLLGMGQEGELDYFKVIRTQVQQAVGNYIDAHNMDQVEVYKDSLGVLLQR